MITESEKYSNEAEYLKGFLQETEKEFCGNILQVTTDIDQVSHSVLNLFASEEEIDVIVTTNIGFAEKIRQLTQSFFSKTRWISTLCPLSSPFPKRTLKNMS